MGRRISINKVEYTAVGIVPAGFAGRLRGPRIRLFAGIVVSRVAATLPSLLAKPLAALRPE